MNKDFLVVLLHKDIRELALLTEGFQGMNTMPAPILQLARQKAESILQNLDELAGIKAPQVPEKQTDAPPIHSSEREELNPDVLYSHTDEPKEKEEETPDFTESIVDYKLSETPTETRLETEIMHQKIDAEEDRSEENTTENEAIIVETAQVEEEIPHVEPITEKTEQEEVLEENSAETLNSVNENVKINDLRSAINIGDRFRFQRELFRGNGEVMNKTLAYLNQLAKYEEAISFLNNKFGWEKDNPHAEDFLQMVRRRFL